MLVRAVPIDIAGVGGRSEICGRIAAHVIATAVSVRNKMFCLRSFDGIAIVVSFFDKALSKDFSTSFSFEVLLSSLVLSSSSSLFLLSILLVLSVCLLNDDGVLVVRPLKDAAETEFLLSRADDDCSRKGPIAVIWIDVNKQDKANPLYRSRLVGKEFNTYKDMSLYTATPPIEALRLTLSLAAITNNGSNFKVMTNDTSQACFDAPVQEGQYIYVKLPQ